MVPQLSSKDILLISAFRTNSRNTLTRLSHELKMPISTIFEKLKRFDKLVLNRFTVLLNFDSLGFEIRVKMMVKVKKESRDELRQFLLSNMNINSLERIGNGYDFFLEGLFRNMRELADFNEKLETFGIEDKQEFHILDELTRESFLCGQGLLGEWPRNPKLPYD